MAKRKNQGLIDSDSDASDDSGSDLDSVSSAAHNALDAPAEYLLVKDTN